MASRLRLLQASSICKSRFRYLSLIILSSSLFLILSRVYFRLAGSKRGSMCGLNCTVLTILCIVCINFHPLSGPGRQYYFTSKSQTPNNTGELFLWLMKFYTATFSQFSLVPGEESFIMATSFISLWSLFRLIDTPKETHFYSHTLHCTNNRALSLTYSRNLILDFFFRGHSRIYVLEQPTGVRRHGHPRIPRGYVLEPPTDMRRKRQSTVST